MIAITSISPTHINKNIQAIAIKSWIDLGFKVYSMNCKNEVNVLKDKYKNVTFIETTRTMELTFGKPLVNLSAVIDEFKKFDNEHFCIINSDIELKSNVETIGRIKKEMENNIVLANRINYKEEKRGSKYYAGIDVFFIHKKFLSVFPQTLHCLGMTFYDYFIPFVATKAGVQCVFLNQDFAYHKDHNAQYSNDNWLKSGRLFIWENNMYQFNPTKEIGKMSNYVYEYIYNSSIKKTI